jgi:hypothetical protein
MHSSFQAPGSNLLLPPQNQFSNQGADGTYSQETAQIIEGSHNGFLQPPRCRRNTAAVGQNKHAQKGSILASTGPLSGG